jgi:DNA mismatch repair protein MutS2
MPSPTFNRKTRLDLQWNDLCAAWGAHCANPRAAEELAFWPFAGDAAEAALRMDQVEAVRRAHHHRIPLAVPELPPCGEHLKRLELGGALPALAFRDLLRVLLATRDLVRAAQQLQDPAVTRLVSGLEPLSQLRVLIEETVDEEGRVLPGASSELYGLRQRRAHLHKDLTTRLERMLERREWQEALQDKFVTVREGRFVLPVKSSYRHQIRGAIHGTSQSGQTVFIEPLEVVEANNRLRELDVDIEVEEFRILSELAAHVAHETGPLRENERLLLRIDGWIAAARLCEALRCTPVHFEDDGPLELVDARHPLLDLAGVAVVPNTIRLEPGRVMVVTGPNAGGKTVVIKTAGLLVLMARMGLPVPAKRGSTCPFYQELHTLIGDDQSLASHVSTFSAQILHLKEVLAAARPGHLLLLDELATGTDPQQGAFLAQAVLESLVERGIATLVTTHFTGLKTLALMDPRFVNVSVGGNALRPDYKLVAGEPGTSEGIAVAGQLGLPEPVIRRARQLALGGDSRVDSLLAELSTLRRQAMAEQEALRAERTELARKTAEVEKDRARLERELREVRKNLTDKTLAELNKCRAVIARLTEKAQIPHANPAELSAGLGKVAAELDALERQDAGPVPEPGTLAPGQRHHSRSLRHVVELVEIDLKKMVVKARAGNLVTQLPIDDLEVRGEESAKKPRARKEKPGKPVPAVGHAAPSGAQQGAEDPGDAGASKEPFLAPANTLDLRGQRVEPALLALERHLDRLFRDNQAGFLVIHGYGSGLLCQAVREHLRASSYVSSFRPGAPGEGGDGVTAVFLT